jgi:ankyrin repeat protein
VTVTRPRKSPLLSAAAKGDVVKLQKLLTKGEDINARDPKTGRTPLMVALGDKQEAAALFLIEQGADVEARDKENFSPLEQASIHGFVQVVTALLDKGADVNGRCRGGDTAIFKAAGWQQIAILELLRARGADLNAQSIKEKPNGNRTPLMAAQHVEVAEWFLRQDVDFSLRNDMGQNALEFARWMQANNEKRGNTGLAREFAARWKQIAEMIELAMKAKTPQ